MINENLLNIKGNYDKHSISNTSLEYGGCNQVLVYSTNSAFHVGKIKYGRTAIIQT